MPVSGEVSLEPSSAETGVGPERLGHRSPGTKEKVLHPGTGVSSGRFTEQGLSDDPCMKRDGQNGPTEQERGPAPVPEPSPCKAVAW